MYDGTDFQDAPASVILHSVDGTSNKAVEFKSDIDTEREIKFRIQFTTNKCPAWLPSESDTTKYIKLKLKFCTQVVKKSIHVETYTITEDASQTQTIDVKSLDIVTKHSTISSYECNPTIY